jgi:nitrogen fixation/metabolism regulation signal transduction histidine kinase
MSVKASIIDLYKKVLGSLENKKNSGFSARKLSSVVIMICIMFVHASWLKHAFLREDYEYIIEILVIDSLFVLLLLGIVTLEQVAKLKAGNKKKDKRDEDTNSEVR